MPLPIAPLATRTIEIAGQTVAYHSLSRASVISLGAFQAERADAAVVRQANLEGAELAIIMGGTDCTEEDARAFRGGNDLDTAGALIDAILVLSGLATIDPKGKVVRKPC